MRGDGDDDDILARVWFVLMWACHHGSHLAPPLLSLLEI
jgi:hypothetical protein